MRYLSPLLGYALKGLYQPLEVIARFKHFTAPLAGDVSIVRNVSYADHPLQTCDILFPTSPSQSPRPVVLIAHGGSWIGGDKVLLSWVSHHIALQGFIVINMNYRLAPQYLYTMQVQDIGHCLKWAAKHISEFGGNHKHTFLMGETSGANLVTSYATAISYPYLRNTFQLPYCIPSEYLKGIVSYFGIFDLERGIFANLPMISHFYEAFLGGNQEKISEMIELASPLRFAHSSLPPVFISAGEADPLFSQSILFARKLRSLDHHYVTSFLQKEDHPDCQHLLLYMQNKTMTKALNEGIRFMKHYSQNSKSIPSSTSTAVA